MISHTQHGRILLLWREELGQMETTEFCYYKKTGTHPFHWEE